MKFIRVIFTFCALMMIGFATSASFAQDTFNGSTYVVVSDPGIDWDSAAAGAAGACPEDANGYLATITSSEEDTFIDNLRRTAFDNEELDKPEVWVGGFQDPIDEEDPKAGWTWVNDEGPFPGDNNGPIFADWRGGEPNDNYGPGSEQHLAIGLGNGDDWNDEGGLGTPGIGNIAGYIVECDVILPDDDVVVFPPNIPNQPVVAVVEEVVLPGRIEQFSCVIKEPKRRKHWQQLNLIRKIKRTPGCEEVAAQLRPEYRAKLRSYQRAFENPLNTTDRNTKDIVVTLVKSTDLFGDPADLTRGVVISEEVATVLNVSDQECRVDGNFLETVDADVSPSTVRVNVSGAEPSGASATNSTIFCNRPRNASRYSDQLYAYPIRNVAPGWWQVGVEAATLRQAFRSFRGVCVDTAYLDRLGGDFIAAMAYVQFGNPTQKQEGISMLQDTTVLALDPDSEGFSYVGCEDAQGQFASRLLAITFQSHRYILFPDEGDEAYVVPQVIKDLLPPFPGDPLPIP